MSGLVSSRSVGYTIFRGFNNHNIEQWRNLFMARYERPDGDDTANIEVDKPRIIIRGLLQERPDLFMPAVTDPPMLDFLEALMGPFVGFDSLQVAMTPSVNHAQAVGVHGWHRDLWEFPGWTEDYLPPDGVNVLTYLQSGPEYGMLRIVPGSHRCSRYVGDAGPGAAQDGEQFVDVQSGDTVALHSSLLHSTSGNHSGQVRIFVSYFYTKCWLPKRDHYSTESAQKIIREARARGDWRVARLFEPDNERILSRVSRDDGESAEQERWRMWLAEDHAAASGDS